MALPQDQIYGPLDTDKRNDAETEERKRKFFAELFPPVRSTVDAPSWDLSEACPICSCAEESIYVRLGGKSCPHGDVK